MKKVLLVLLALIMVLSTVTTAIAVPGNGMPPGQAKQMVKAGIFGDIADVEEWAGDAIYFIAEKGIIKGDGSGNFLPNKPLTHGEIVTMLIRMLDLEPEVDMDAELPEWLDEEDAASWMYGYLALADEIFGEYSGFRAMMNPNTPVKRMEIAQYIKWIIDNEDFSAEITDDLDSMFIDADEVDADYIEAVKLMKHTGLMIGYQNKMQPHKPVTRAQFTLIMQRLFLDFDFDFDWMDNDSGEYDYIYGIFDDIDEGDDPDTIKLEDEPKYDLAEDVDISGDDGEDSLSDIDEGDYIRLKIDSEDLVVAIYVYEDEPEITSVKGNLEDFNYDDIDDEMVFDWIKVEIDEDTIEKYSNVTDEAIILVDLHDMDDDDNLGLREELLDLNVEIEIEDDYVVKIDVKDKMQGTLDSFIYDDGKEYKDESDNYIVEANIIPEFEEESDDYPKNYEFDDDVVIKLNGKTKIDGDTIVLEDLEDLSFDDDIVYEINLWFNITIDDNGTNTEEDDEYVLLIDRIHIDFEE